jgi:hypothetical protein
MIWHLNPDDGQYTLTNALAGAFQDGAGNTTVAEWAVKLRWGG